VIGARRATSESSQPPRSGPAGPHVNAPAVPWERCSSADAPASPSRSTGTPSPPCKPRIHEQPRPAFCPLIQRGFRAYPRHPERLDRTTGRSEPVAGVVGCHRGCGADEPGPTTFATRMFPGRTVLLAALAAALLSTLLGVGARRPTGPELLEHRHRHRHRHDLAGQRWPNWRPRPHEPEDGPAEDYELRYDEYADYEEALERRAPGWLYPTMAGQPKLPTYRGYESRYRYRGGPHRPLHPLSRGYDARIRHAANSRSALRKRYGQGLEEPEDRSYEEREANEAGTTGTTGTIGITRRRRSSRRRRTTTTARPRW
jgi:hypothetical protein